MVTCLDVAKKEGAHANGREGTREAATATPRITPMAPELQVEGTRLDCFCRSKSHDLQFAHPESTSVGL